MDGKMTDDKAIARAIENALEIIRKHPANMIAVVEYTNDEDFKKVNLQEFKFFKSAKKHLAMLKELQAQVAQELGKEIILVPFDLTDYEQWRSAKKLENNNAHRSMWAAEKAGFV